MEPFKHWLCLTLHILFDSSMVVKVGTLVMIMDMMLMRTRVNGIILMKLEAGFIRAFATGLN